MFFQEISMFSLFKVTTSHQNAMNKVGTIICCSEYYQNDFHYWAKPTRREALASDDLALSLIFFNLHDFINLINQFCQINCHNIHSHSTKLRRGLSEENRITPGSQLTNISEYFRLPAFY